jgi:glycerate kinase
MRVLVAPGSYKSTIKSIVAANTIAKVAQRVLPHASIQTLVLADGGEGTLDTFGVHFNCSSEYQQVRDPFGKTVTAQISFLDDGAAVIETSQAIGFSLVKTDRMNPFVATSHGVGDLINYALEKGAGTLLVTMGDSATMDMGVGMLDALGVSPPQVPWSCLRCAICGK